MDKLPEDVARLVERLEAGLEGVWRGQWAAGVVTDGDGREVPHDGYVSDIDGEGLDIEIKTYDDRAQKVARHIANCDPDTIRALLSALKAQAAEIGHAELPVKGCICPPTSEKTCQRWDCGRKLPTTITGFATIEMSICDCERSDNGIGISGRECDCMEKPRDP